MTPPLPPADPDGAPAPAPAGRAGVGRAMAVCLGVVAGTSLLGVAAGYLWAGVAPRALLVMVGPGAADAVHSETGAFIAADAWFCVIAAAGGVISGAAGYVLAVRRHGPLAMGGVLAGALAAAFIARAIGERSGLASFRHLLGTLPSGAHLHDSLTLGASGALAFWPMAAGLVAGGFVALARRRGGAAPG